MYTSSRSREQGQGLVEYALVLVLVAVVVILILAALGSTVAVVFARIVGAMNGQTMTGTGTEYVVIGYNMTVAPAGPGACNVSLSNVSALVVNNGRAVENSATGAIAVSAPGGSGNMHGTTNALGIASGMGATLAGVSCPSQLSIGNTGFRAAITP